MSQTEIQREPDAASGEIPVVALGLPEMFALWAIRLWVAAYRGAGNLLPELREGFRVAGMGEAWLDLDEWLTRLLGSVRRPLDIRPVSGRSLSADELGMVRWLGALQEADPAPAQCAYLRAIAVPGRRLARSFAEAGLSFGVGAGHARADAGDADPARPQ